MLRFLLAAATLLIFCNANADWTLSNEKSLVSFISVKKGDVAEIHYFRQLEGGVDSDGRVTLSIELASVDTAVEIRDKRMRELLFETDVFPTATLSTRVDIGKLNALEPGATAIESIKGELELHGQKQELQTDLIFARLDETRILVASYKPMVIDAGKYALVEGINKLREIAGLPSISNAVPVSLVLTFQSQ